MKRGRGVAVQTEGKEPGKILAGYVTSATDGVGEVASVKRNNSSWPKSRTVLLKSNKLNTASPGV